MSAGERRRWAGFESRPSSSRGPAAWSSEGRIWAVSTFSEEPTIRFDPCAARVSASSRGFESRPLRSTDVSAAPSQMPRTARRPSSMSSISTSGSLPACCPRSDRSINSSPSGTATESFGSPLALEASNTFPAMPARATFDVMGTTWVCQTSTPSTSSDETTTRPAPVEVDPVHPAPRYHGAERSIRSSAANDSATVGGSLLASSASTRSCWAKPNAEWVAA